MVIIIIVIDESPAIIGNQQVVNVTWVVGRNNWHCSDYLKFAPVTNSNNNHRQNGNGFPHCESLF